VALLLSLPPAAGAGTVVEARCACGYHIERLALFGGFANFRQVCLFPALCQDRQAVVVVNLLAPQTRPASCPTGPLSRYDTPALAPAAGASVADWRLPDGSTVRLFDGGYTCPHCSQKTLHFRTVGFWD
jgi:hypothetical protein